MRRSLINDEELVPLRKRVVLAFSCTRGSCFARTRFVRAFLGLLGFLLAWKGGRFYHERQRQFAIFLHLS